MVQATPQADTLPLPRETRAREATAPRLGVDSFGVTDPGRVRTSNEDHFLIAALAKALQVQQTSLDQPTPQYSTAQGHLFLVADGMGGHRAGERASALAIGTIEGFVLNTLRGCGQLQAADDEDVLAELQSALRRADQRIFEVTARHPEYSGMGTTVTMAYHLDVELFVTQVGDSRGYLLRC